MVRKLQRCPHVFSPHCRFLGGQEARLAGSRMVGKFLYAFGLSMGISFGGNSDCGIIAPSLCSMLDQAESDNQKFGAVITINHPDYPADDSTCKGLNPNTDSTIKCPTDSNFALVRAKLLEYANSLLTSHDLWDVRNPSQRIPIPNEPTMYFHVSATKATLIDVSRENYIFRVDLFVEDGPVGIRPVGIMDLRSATKADAIYLINGRKRVESAISIRNWKMQVTH